MDETLPTVYFTHPEMMIYEDRLQSFEHWSKQIVPDKYSLASAGFVYTGDGDAVQCFGCSVRISEWDKNDFPWAEHLKWSPDCVFLKIIGYGAPQKGDHANETTAFGAYKKPRHDPKEAMSHTGLTGFHTGPNNAVQSNPQPGAQPFGRPQQSNLQSGAAFASSGLTLGGGKFLPRHLFYKPVTGGKW
jgi:hypothetical protein